MQRVSGCQSVSRSMTLRESIVVTMVSAYLLAVGVFLTLTRQIPAPGLLRILRALVRRPYAGAVQDIRPERGHCYVAEVPVRLLSDREHSSSLLLFEDRRALGPAHASHDVIRASGGGQYSHWGTILYFSASDNSDPRSNGRCYTVREVRRAASSTA
jgi:hypothetical protein